MGGEKECRSESSELSNSTSSTFENINSDFKDKPEENKQDEYYCHPAKRFSSISCQATPADFPKTEPAPCHCQTYRAGYEIPVNYKQDIQPMLNKVNWKWPRSNYLKERDKTYEIKLKKKRCQLYSKPHIFFEVSDRIPQKKDIQMANQSQDESKPLEKEEKTERIDIYYFDHGNSAYFRTTDSPPITLTGKFSEKSENGATRFWAEVFGPAHITLSFVTALILQLLRFLLYSIVRPLTVGILQLLADYFIKPLLSIIFNALIQPFLILFYNVATSFRDLCEPIAEALGFFLKEAANVFKACRIIEINHNTNGKEQNVITACT